MIEIIVGTNRQDARTKQISELILALYEELNAKVQLLDLTLIENLYTDGPHSYKKDDQNINIQNLINRVNAAEGLVVVCPEYNGSYPGILKYFIDHWSYPESFEFRPVAFVGLGGKFGGLRPVEHLQGVFGYRNAFMYPERVFIFNVWDQMKGRTTPSEETVTLLKRQAQGFVSFVKALNQSGLSAHARKAHQK